MKYTPGQTKKGGRKQGTPNKINASIKEAIRDVFFSLQSDNKHNLLEWAKKHPKDFYTLAAKLIPTELNSSEALPAPKIILIDWKQKEKLSS